MLIPIILSTTVVSDTYQHKGKRMGKFNSSMQGSLYSVKMFGLSVRYYSS